MNHRELNSKFYHLFSGPERIPTGAALGRTAATFRIIPAPLPGADIRALAERSAPHPRARARRGRFHPTCFQQGAGSHTQHVLQSETVPLVRQIKTGKTQ